MAQFVFQEQMYGCCTNKENRSKGYKNNRDCQTKAILTDTSSFQH